MPKPSSLVPRVARDTGDLDADPRSDLLTVAIAGDHFADRAGEVTVWIDAETQLIRKVFEDPPKGYPARWFQRKTITLQPRGNPVLEDARFQFKVPE